MVAVRRSDHAVAADRYRSALEMAAETGSADVIGSSLDAIASLLLGLGRGHDGARLAAVAARILREAGGTGSIDMAGQELPLAIASRTMEPAALDAALAEAKSLTTADAIREGLGLARQILTSP